MEHAETATINFSVLSRTPNIYNIDFDSVLNNFAMQKRA
jgi:hypothetical protein